jgi:hypothetical protein
MPRVGVAVLNLLVEQAAMQPAAVVTQTMEAVEHWVQVVEEQLLPLAVLAVAAVTTVAAEAAAVAIVAAVAAVPVLLIHPPQAVLCMKL